MPPDKRPSDEEQEEDDYMSMTFSTPSTQPTTSLARKQAAARAAAERGHPKSKKELEAEREKKREADLSTTLDPSNRGARMLARLGFKGGALGAAGNENARTEPITLSIKDDRGGVGMENEKKRKIREILAQEAGREKRVKEDAEEYVSRVRREKEDKRLEGCWWGAMRVAEGLDEESQEQEQDRGKTNVLWRTLGRDRRRQEQEKKARREYMDRFSRQLPEVEDREEDAEDKIALGTEVEDLEDDEDTELDEYLALEPGDRLTKVVQYLRDTYHYCFWCKYRYPDDKMEGCPGLTEEDHD